MRFRTCLYLVVSSFFWVLQVRAGPATHRREKIALYLIYDIICDIYGTATQQMMYPQQPNHKAAAERNLGTKTEDKRFVYQEFMARISNSGKDKTVNWNIRSPVDVGIEGALADLDRHDIGAGIIHVEKLSPSLKDYTPTAETMHKNVYAVLLEKALRRYTYLSTDPKTIEKIGIRKQLMSQLITEIYTLRREEMQLSVVKLLTEQFGIPDVVAPEHDSQIRGGKKYRQLDMAATLEANTESDGQLKPAFKKHFNDRDAFIKYIDGGLREGSPLDGIVKRNRNHWHVVQLWWKASTYIVNTSNAGKLCS